MSYETKKRILDLVVATALMIAFIPFWVVIPILILLDSGPPVFFSHKRVGKNGKKFDLFKSEEVKIFPV